MSRRLVVEADGGSRGNPGPAAYGSLVRDAATGALLATHAEFIGVASNNVAEYGGLVAGLRLALEIDPDALIEVRMDSKLVVEQMSGRWQIKHEDMKRLAAEARAVVPAARVRYTWVPREQNKDADRLANEALDDAARGAAWRGSAVPGRPAPADEVASAQHDAPGSDPVVAPSQPQPPPDVGEATTLLMLRHGVTAYTPERRFSGRGGADLPLTAQGRAQALAAAEAVAAVGGVDVVVASPLRRTLETAQHVADRLGVGVRVDDGWVECAFGEWDGLTGAEVAERWPAELAAWQASTAVAPPGGEPFDEVERRVRVARDRTLARHPRARVLVVTHATPIKQMVRLALGSAPESLWRMDSSPASLTTVRWWTDGGASVGSYNETGHLLSLPPI